MGLPAGRLSGHLRPRLFGNKVCSTRELLRNIVPRLRRLIEAGSARPLKSANLPGSTVVDIGNGRKVQVHSTWDPTKDQGKITMFGLRKTQAAFQLLIRQDEGLSRSHRSANRGQKHVSPARIARLCKRHRRYRCCCSLGLANVLHCPCADSVAHH